MAWTAITDRDICIQGEDLKYNCMASGTIKAGQALVNAGGVLGGTIYAVSSVANAGIPKKFIGVAGEDATKGNSVMVYGQGAICNVRADNTVVAGARVFADNEGEFDTLTMAAGMMISSAGLALTDGTAAGHMTILITH